MIANTFLLITFIIVHISPVCIKSEENELPVAITALSFWLISSAILKIISIANNETTIREQIEKGDGK